MSTTQTAKVQFTRKFPPFDLNRLITTIFSPKKGEKVCVLIDLNDPEEVIDFAFLLNPEFSCQRKAYEVFYQGFKQGAVPEISVCDFFAYKKTGGSNLDLPTTATAPDGAIFHFERDIYPEYDIILCISTYSATAPLTAAAKKYEFRGATLHGVNDIIINSGLSVDYHLVSAEAEKMRQGLTGADSLEIDFEVAGQACSLFVALDGQEAQKSHGICPHAPDVVNLPAGEVYFVPTNAKGSFPIKLEEDGTLALMHVDQGRVHRVTLIEGNRYTVEDLQEKLSSDPATGVLGEVGFGTQVLPFSGADIQDEKIFGTFHLATGRNDHLTGSITKDRFVHAKNATHDDILFSLDKTPEILVKQVRMKRQGKEVVLIENNQPAAYLNHLK